MGLSFPGSAFKELTHLYGFVCGPECDHRFIQNVLPSS